MTAATVSGLTAEDKSQLREHGISTAEAARQLDLLRSPPPPVRLDRPCTVGDGIAPLDTLTGLTRLDCWQSAAADGRLLKFVPASGAASRMFDLAQTMRQTGALSRADILKRDQRGDPTARQALELIDRLVELPFAGALAATAPLQNIDLGSLSSRDEISHLLDALLTSAGLDLPALAKGLIPFHRYESGTRTAFEEHLLEGAALIVDRRGVCRYHFTVPKVHQAAFEALGARFGSDRRIELQLEFSNQDPGSDTLAVTADGKIARRSDGRLLFRPGGHGALLRNLAQADGDVVVLKNIDNVMPESRQADLILWQKRMTELLLRTESRTHRLQEKLEATDWRDAIEDAEAFCRQQLHWSPGASSAQTRRAQLLHRLDRPLRVCGMVPNEGEPGGGPFWVVDADGEQSVQIVESAQIDASDADQSTRWQASTHFNPVLLVASLRDRHRRPYRLSEFVDPAAVFVTEKSINGRPARVLEHPGLWNGAMAHWNTLFVEVPLSTFAPVKTVLDLLRPQHRESGS